VGSYLTDILFMNDRETKQTNSTQRKSWRIARRCLVAAGICLTLVCFFYTEELWRGKRAWEECEREAAAQGVDFNWAHHIPAPVPDEQNVFGVPEMQQWFVKGLSEVRDTEFLHKLELGQIDYDDYDGDSKRMTVAEVNIGPSGTPQPEGFVSLRWDDPGTRAQAAQLLTNAIGPIISGMHSPLGVALMLRRPQDIHPAQIFLQCQTPPSQEQLEKFLTNGILLGEDKSGGDLLHFESAGSNSYRVTFPVFVSAVDYLEKTDPLEPQFALIRQALQRSVAQMKGDYGTPSMFPTLNFTTVHTLAKVIAERAQCHLLLSQPDEALLDLTLINDACHKFMEVDGSKPLVSALVDLTVRFTYADAIAEGWRRQAWREPQWAALEGQLKEINLLGPLEAGYRSEREYNIHYMETVNGPKLVAALNAWPDSKPSLWEEGRFWLLGELVPRGWLYQAMAARFHRSTNEIASLDPANERVFPEKVAAWQKQVDATHGHWPPFYASIFATGFKLAGYSQGVATRQTKVNQSIIVCGLERYHLARGEYPETLEALVPQFLEKIPHDVIGGQPPHYRREANGKFLLYSVGWSGQDGGGVAGSANTNGDWVWPNM
jgi:hypothetical protein